MDVCVIGGRGFVGSNITEQLRKHSHHVVTMDPNIGDDTHISASILSDDLDEHLEGFDVVVNMVGLSPIKPPVRQDYRDLHVTGAKNVVAACETNDVDRLVHMSALGADPDSNIEFLSTKGKGEQAVLTATMDAVVFKPSMIFDHGNELVEYAKLFSRTRMFPHMRTPVQPIYRKDVADLFTQAVEGDIDKEVMEIGGPHTMTMFEFVKQVYNIRGYRCYPLPVIPVMKMGLYVMEHIPLAPWGKDQARFLEFSNTVSGENDADKYIELTSVEDWLDAAF